jgi:RNA polymerase sigma-54 factor
MAVSIKIGLQQNQKLVMTQSLKQSIEMLQLSTVDLAELITRELVDNPILEEDTLLPGDGGDGEAVFARITSSLSGDDTLSERIEDRSSAYPDASDGGFSHDSDDEDRTRRFIENAVAQSESLIEHLLSQARIASKNDAELALLEEVITSLDESGLLGVPVETIALEMSTDAGRVRAAILQIASFDPPGCAAADVKESLELQARAKYPEDRLLHTVIAEYFKDLENLDYDRIARGLGITLAEVVEVSRLIHTLNPYPGRGFSARGTRYIVPDLEVKIVDDDLILTLIDDWIPQVRINGYYARMLRKKNIDKNLRMYIKDRMQSARDLLKNISNRRDTILRVAGAILLRQKEFLLRGQGYLRPLTHAEIAREVGLHESTISRTTSNKFVQTPWGTFELKYFFASRLKGSAAGEVSSDHVMSAVRDLVAREDAANPLSDEEILVKLQTAGVSCARRTIAKYRAVLGIPPSNKRRKLNMIRNEVKE